MLWRNFEARNLQTCLQSSDCATQSDATTALVRALTRYCQLTLLLGIVGGCRIPILLQLWGRQVHTAQCTIGWYAKAYHKHCCFRGHVC